MSLSVAARLLGAARLLAGDASSRGSVTILAIPLVDHPWSTRAAAAALLPAERGRIEPALAQSPGRKLGPRGDPKPLVQATEVRLDRLGTDAKGTGDFIVGATIGDEPDDIELARRELRHGTSRT